VTSPFVFFAYSKIKKKEIQNKIKKPKKKKSKIKPSPSFTTLTEIFLGVFRVEDKTSKIAEV